MTAFALKVIFIADFQSFYQNIQTMGWPMHI